MEQNPARVPPPVVRVDAESQDSSREASPERAALRPSAAEATAGVIVSVGADIDVAELDREIRAEIARKEREGLYPPELLQEIAEDAVRDRMEALRAAAELTLDPPIHSTRPVLGPVVALVKRVIAKALRWHARWQVGQVQTLGGSAVAVLSAMEDRLEEMERTLHHLAEQVAHIQAVQLTGGVAPASGRPVLWDVAAGDAARVRELAARPQAGRVLCLGCGDGRFLAALAASGAVCYGVEPDPELAHLARERGLEVHSGSIIEHLAAVAPASLAAIVVERGEKLDAAAIEDLFRWSVTALVTDGLLLVDVPGDGGFAPAGETERARGVPYGFLAESVGFRRVRVEGGPGTNGRLGPVPTPSEPALGGMAAAINANLKLVDEAVYGPRLVRVVARR